MNNIDDKTRATIKQLVEEAVIKTYECGQESYKTLCELYGADVVKVAEIFVNSYCWDDIYEILCSVANVLRNTFQALADTVAFMLTSQSQTTPITDIILDNSKGGIKLILEDRWVYIPP